MADINGSVEVPRYPTALLNTFPLGFSILSSVIYEYLKIDATIYIPAMLLVSLLVFASQYSGDYLWCRIEAYFMSTARHQGR
jgi:mitochondrial chaperone BCS1